MSFVNAGYQRLNCPARSDLSQRPGSVAGSCVGSLAVSVCNDFVALVTGDFCDVNQCQNGGTCLAGTNETPFSCICPDGFTGIDCNDTEEGTVQAGEGSRQERGPGAPSDLYVVVMQQQ